METKEHSEAQRDMILNKMEESFVKNNSETTKKTTKRIKALEDTFLTVPGLIGRPLEGKTDPPTFKNLPEFLQSVFTNRTRDLKTNANKLDTAIEDLK